MKFPVQKIDMLFQRWEKTIFWSVVGIISAIILVTGYFSLFTGAGYNDEAWLALMVQNQHNGFWTSFAHYYELVKDSSLVMMRLFVALFHALACAVFVWGVVKYYRPFEKNVFPLSIGLWCIAALVPNVFWLGGICLAPDYKFVAFDCALIGLGLFFLGLNTSWVLILSGLFFVQILFNLPQVGLIAPVLLFAAGLKSPKKLLWFIAGGLIGIAVFFLLISSPENFKECITYSGARIAVNNSSRHGTSMLITGYIKILLEFAEIILPSAFALFAATRLKAPLKNQVLTVVVLLLLTTFALNTLRVLSWKDGGVPVCSMRIFLIFSCYSFIRYVFEPAEEKDRLLNIILASLFVLVPVIFCTGTDKGFGNRLTFYIGVMFVGLVISIYCKKDRFLSGCLALFLLFAFFAGLVYWKQNSNFQLVPKTKCATVYGLPEKAPVTAEMANHLLEVKKYTDNAKYIVNDPLHWYVPYLLKKKMIHLTSFRYYSFDDVTVFLKDKNVKAEEVIFLEAPEYAMPEDRLNDIKKYLNASRIERIVLSEQHHIIRFHK